MKLGVGGGELDGKHVRREKSVAPRKRKFSELEADDKACMADSDIKEITEMYCPFVRGHYTDDLRIPKTYLMRWLRQTSGERHEVPKYYTWQKEKMFRSIVMVNGQAFSSESWEKNKRYSEQATAIVALHCLGVRTIQLEKGASTGSGLVYTDIG